MSMFAFNLMTRRENYISFLAINQKIIWKVCQALSTFTEDFFGGSEDTESACSAGDPGSIPGLRRSLGEGNDYPLQYSCLENSINRGAW